MEMAKAGQFAIVRGASTGIGFELARLCAAKGYDLVVAADEPEIETAAQALRNGANSSAVGRFKPTLPPSKVSTSSMTSFRGARLTC